MRLGDAIVALANRLCNHEYEWDEIKALMACGMVALDRSIKPGVRLLGIGETLHRLIGKMVVQATGNEVMETCGAQQLLRNQKRSRGRNTHKVSPSRGGEINEEDCCY
eukprot:GHVN01105247.1.p2 GENE.GHVN01105247.1~~GHVN01105247.1.p2  ORF type:complete len:108 (-),score=16.00 GHVN01105247.1:461-784(-)